MRRLLRLAAILLAGAGTARAESYAWVQYVAVGAEARVVTTEATCPPARLDGQPVAMNPHSAQGEDYPVIVCKLVLPAGVKSIIVAEQTLPPPPADPHRILVLGDTGCRIKGVFAQACNNPTSWPFRRIAELGAALRPDLILHVGDYHYRESPCPPLIDCTGSPHGDNWPVWREDFFAPAAGLLPVAPWIMLRGNHEICGRGGKGWSRTLEPTPFDAGAQCQATMTPPYVVQLPGLALAVMDSSSLEERAVDPAQAAGLRRDFAALAGLGPTWIVTHRPIWAAVQIQGAQVIGESKTLAAAANAIPANVGAIIGGHLHSFQVLTYTADLPPQLVIGHGGDWLDAGLPADPAGWRIGAVTVASGIVTTGQFGFAMLEKQQDGWRLTNYDDTSKARTLCALRGRSVACRPAP